MCAQRLAADAHFDKHFAKDRPAGPRGGTWRHGRVVDRCGGEVGAALEVVYRQRDPRLKPRLQFSADPLASAVAELLIGRGHDVHIHVLGEAMQDRVRLRQRRAALEYHQDFGALFRRHYRMADRLGHVEVFVDHLLNVLRSVELVSQRVEDRVPDLAAGDERADFSYTASCGLAADGADLGAVHHFWLGVSAARRRWPPRRERGISTENPGPVRVRPRLPRAADRCAPLRRSSRAGCCG